MRSVEIYKRQLHRLVGEKQGQNLDYSRSWASGQVSHAYLAEVLALPVDADSVVDMNDSTGALYFVPGISDLGGTDVLR